MTKLLKWAAIQIYYYLIAADGEICDQEMETFLEIAKETDPLFDQYKEDLIEECQNQVNKITGKENCYAVIKEGIDLVHRDQRKEILRGLDMQAGYINSKMFLWNMLSIVMSDGTYADAERKSLQYVVEKFKLDATLFLEWENAMKAILDIDRSIAQMLDKESPFVIKGKYSDIESSETAGIIKEYTNRREIILNSVKEDVYGLGMGKVIPGVSRKDSRNIDEFDDDLDGEL
ncbi:MAG: TerB family tellurite resistance protein [Blautia sp.]|nr:TerB family tellurite resistance protein [Blautia sp.]